MDQTTGSTLPGTPIPSSFTFNSSSFRRSYAEPSSSSSSAPSHEPPTSAYLGDDFERQRHQRQNQEIIRLCALKSIQIRQSEAKLSELENENLDLRTALRNAKRKLETNIDKPPSLSPPRHGRERPSAEDGSGIYSAPYLAKQGRAVSPDEYSGIDNSRYEEEFDQEQEFANQHGRGFKRNRTRSSEPSFSSKQFLLSKLDQVQTVFQNEHEAMCTMMRSYNSTTRLYKDILHLLETEALKSHDNGCQGSYDNRTSGAQPSIPSLHAWNRQSKMAWTPSELETPEHSDNMSSTANTMVQPRAALSYSFIASKRPTENTTQLPIDSRSAIPTSPKAGKGMHSGLFSRVQYGDRSHISTAERDQLLKDNATTIGLTMKDPDPPEISRAIRPAIRGLPKTTTLPSIDEDITDVLFSPLHERDLSLIDERLVGTLTSPLSDQDSPLLIEPGNINRNLGRSHTPEASDISSAFRTTRKTQPAPSDSHKITSGVKPADVVNERSKSLILSKGLLEKYKSHASMGSSSGGSVPPKITRSRSPGNLETILADRRERSDKGDRQGNDVASSYDGVATSTSVNVNNTITTSSDIKRKRTTATRSERTTPSPMIKSRTAISSQYLRSLKPQQSNRRISKSLVDEDEPSMPPLSVVRNVSSISQKNGLSIIPSSPVARPPSANAIFKSPVVSSAQISTQEQSNTVVGVDRTSSPGEAHDDSVILMPPPAPRLFSTSNPSQNKKQYRAKRVVSVDGSQIQPKSNPPGIALATTPGEAEDIHDHRQKPQSYTGYQVYPANSFRGIQERIP
ncbi:MAG: hypothetical protein J3Q66DRAFT_417127 [Benniella sp.]|nr:MAG: hypothetical protein J3Q66DRAFT_417127 [Benniella sp.]